jgi:uncharacterized protein YkwD
LRHNKFKNVLLMSVLITVLVGTSLGGAFASAAQAATPDETMQNNGRGGTNKAVVGGVLAVGLIAALAGHSGHDKSEVLAEKSSPAVVKPQAPTVSSATVQPQAPTVPSSGISTDEQKAFALLNADRTANGLQPLKLNAQLSSLGKNYAKDMINRGFFAHNNPEGQTPFDRMHQAGVNYTYAGENLAINTSVTAAEKAFMNSTGHRANILNKNYTEVGLGVQTNSKGSVYVVQEFIKP